MRRPTAFTLVELLVVIAIIGILVALLLPAVQSAREAARRSQCQNNLKQLGLALLNHHDVYGYFPESQTAAGEANGSGCEAGYYSWHSRILPFLEENPLYDSIDFDVNMAGSCDSGDQINFDHPNARAAATVVSAFLCPSDNAAGANEIVMGTANPASDSYAANAGWPSSATGYEGERTAGTEYNGIISLTNPNEADRPGWHPRSKINIRKITDGTSHTSAVAERLIQDTQSPDVQNTAIPSLISFHILTTPKTLSEMASGCNAASTHSDAVESAYAGRAWISGWVVDGTDLHALENAQYELLQLLRNRGWGEFAGRFPRNTEQQSPRGCASCPVRWPRRFHHGRYRARSLVGPW